MNNLRVGVVRGSPDHAYEDSISSGRHILEKMPTKYRPVDIFIDKEGMWHVGGVPISPAQALRQIDVVFNALHGAYTHEGGILRVCEREGVPFTGSGYMASSLSFHKDFAKKQMRGNNIAIANYLVVNRNDNHSHILEKVFSLLSGVMIVKPVRGSMQKDIRVVRGHFELSPILEELFLFYEELLIEEYISGTEISIGLLENFRGEKSYIFVPLEVRKPQFSIFRERDSDVKTNPAHGLSQNVKEKIFDIARTLHKIFDSRHYSQVEMILHPSGRIYVIDFNTHPYLGKDGTYMKMLSLVGARPEEFIDTVISRV